MTMNSHRRLPFRLMSLGWAITALLCSSCKEHYVIGDHVFVEWEGNDYPAVIVDAEGPARFSVHYDGYDAIWDETINVARIKGRVKGPVVPPPPPAKVMRRGGAPLDSSSASGGHSLSRYKVGQRVRVSWNNHIDPASIVEVLGEERYRVHYEGFGPEWDETIDVSRIKEPR